MFHMWESLGHPAHLLATELNADISVATCSPAEFQRAPLLSSKHGGWPRATFKCWCKEASFRELLTLVSTFPHTFPIISLVSRGIAHNEYLMSAWRYTRPKTFPRVARTVLG